jgi:GH15 family glucan-1,4-alpha-glucosidase
MSVSATQPSSLSAPGLYLSNWSDLVAIWMASSRAQTDDTNAGPRLGEIHLLDGPAQSRGVNQIVDYTGFFRDETRGVYYTDAHQFASEAWFESDALNAGTLTTRYVAYAGRPMDVEIRRSYVAVPDQPFFVVRYSVVNRGSITVDFNLLDQLHLANVAGADPNRRVHAWYDANRNALVADMSASGQFFVVLGAFEAMDSHQVGDDANHAAGGPTAAGWFHFQAQGALPNNGDLRASDVDLAFQKKVSIAPGATVSVSFYLSVRTHLDAALAASDTARSKPASAWFDATAASYTAWLHNAGRGRDVAFDDDGINQAFRRSLIVIKNAQNPSLGTVPAATNPYAYGHKTWVRDASVAAIALDASGHPEDAALYWRWMAGAQGNSGAWKTTYSAWDGSYLSFVEPEDDSIGSFLYGVCRHYMLTGDAAFLREVWPAVQRAADYVLTNHAPNGFGPADYSIWEESSRGLEHNTYTQAWYVLGFYATQYLAEVRGDTELADWYAGGPASIMTAFQRPDDAYPPGMWNSSGRYYNRAVRFDNTVQTLVDSSSNVVAAFGVVDAASQRSWDHVAKTTSMLACSQWGLSRYANDDYYFSDPYDPAGNEALAPSPAWPQMSMWVAAYENAVGSPNALQRLQWFVRTMGVGYTPQGEAVSNVTGASVLSSMCEPLTASSFVLAALCLQRLYALPLVPPIYNAGARKAIAVSFATSGDWPQWSNVPYFIAPAPLDPAATPQTTIRRVYLANDDRCICLRVDNAGGSLPKYATAPAFAIRVYSDDFAHGGVESSKAAMDGGTLPRAATYMVERRSDSDMYSHWRVVAGVWKQLGTVPDAIAPQWDAATGRIEALVPIWTVSSSTPAAGAAWAHMCIALGVIGADGTVDEVHRVAIHYRLSGGDQPWIYGNIEV